MTLTPGVDTAKSFPLISFRTDGATYDSNDFVRAEITTSTTLDLTAPDGGLTAFVEWQVVEYTDANVQTGSLSFGSVAPSLTASLSPSINTAKAWLIYTYESSGGSGPNIGQKLLRGVITDGTTLTFDRNNTGQTMIVTWYLVEFMDGTVTQHASELFSSAETQRDVTLPSVTDTAASFATGGNFLRGGRSPYAADDNAGVGWFTLDLTGPSNLRITRGLTGSATADVGWFVVQFRTIHYRSIGTASDYSTGTLNATDGSPVLIGTGTAWMTANRGRGDRILVDGTDYTILAVSSETQLTLSTSFIGVSGPGKAYTIARQFTTLQAWEDCISFAGCPALYPFPVVSASLVADNRSEVGIAYKDSAFTSAGGVPIVRFEGSTTDAFHDITLTADWFNRHFGIAGGAGNNVVLDMLAELASNAVRIRDEFVTVEWLEITGGAGMDGFEVSSIISPSQVTLRYNLIHDTASGDGMQLRDADLTVDVYNNIIFGVNKAIEFNQEVPTSARILNNTIYDSDEGVFAADGAGCPGCKYDSVLLQNNIAHTFTGPAYYVPSTSSTGFATEESSNNLASDATGTTHSAAGGGINSVAYASMNFVSATDLHITSGSAAEDQAVDLSASFIRDIDSGLRSVPWDIGADDILATTAVELVSFSARGLEGSVELSWESASELNNLGFHLYRSTSEDGSYERITATAIPGLGSSPVGTSYSYKDFWPHERGDLLLQAGRHRDDGQDGAARSGVGDTGADSFG